jgi:hypothetical protein
MAKAERTYQKLLSGDRELFGEPPKQQTFFQIDEQLTKQAEATKVSEIVAIFPDIIMRKRWENRSVQLRDVLGEFVKNFKWKTTRVEWIKALRQSETNGWLKLNGTDDGDMIYFAEKV